MNGPTPLSILSNDAPAFDHAGKKLYPLEATSRILALGPNPDSAGGCECGLAVDGAVFTVRRLDKIVAHASGDEDLSEKGRKKRLEAESPGAVQAIGRHWQNIAQEEIGIANREKELYAVPQLEPTDAVGATTDREIRDYVRALTGEERSKMIRSLGDPEHARMVLALCRSPVSCGIPETVGKELWRQSVTASHPAEVAQMQAEKASVEWARIVLTSCAKLVGEIAELDRNQIVAALSGAPDLNQGAHRVFGIADADFQSAASTAGRNQ